MGGAAIPPMALAVPVGAGFVEFGETATVVVFAATGVSVSCFTSGW